MPPAAEMPAPGLRRGEHICGFYSGPDARDSLTAAWMDEGVRAGQKCVCFFDDSPVLRDRMVAELPRRRGQIEFHGVDEAYVPTGRFCKEAMLSRLEAAIDRADADGYADVRLLGDMSWVIRPGVDTKDVFAYEAEVNALSPRHRASFVCLYDLDRVDGDLVIEVLRTHAKVLVNGLVIANPYHVGPGSRVGS